MSVVQRRILFAVGQFGSLEYLAPLLRDWCVRELGVEWVLAIPDRLRIALGRFGLEQAPVLEGDLTSTIGMERALDGRSLDLIVASASGSAIEETALRYAKKNDAPSIRFIDTWYRYRERLSFEDGTLTLPDRVLVIDECAIKEAKAVGIPNSLLYAVGHPAWEMVETAPPADRRHVLFVSQPVQRHYGTSLGYTEETCWNEFLAAARANPSLIQRIYYAVHPDDNIESPDTNDLVTVTQSGKRTLENVGAVVGMFSSLLTDAVLAGRHVVSFQPNARRSDINPLGSCFSYIPRATDSKTLISALASEKHNVTGLRLALIGSRQRLEDALLSTLSSAKRAERSQ